MIAFRLSNSDKRAYVCDCHAYLIGNRKWSLSSKGYVCRGIRSRREGWQKTLLFHRLVTNAKQGEVVDHINGDGRDNRCSNLRICTQQQNTFNRTSLNSNNTSGVRGIYWRKDTKRWSVSVMIDRRANYFGCYKNKDEARYVHKQVAKQIFGEYIKV